MIRGNKASTVIDTVFVEGQELTDKKQIPEAFNNHFVNIWDKLAGTIEQTDTCPTDIIAESSSTKQWTNTSSVPNRFLSVGMYRIIAFCLICQNAFGSRW